MCAKKQNLSLYSKYSEDKSEMGYTGGRVK